MTTAPTPDSALLVVDLQNDFCPGGSLGVPEGDRLVPVANRYVELFDQQGRPVYASRDWHPPRTRHFQQYGGVWPAHCIQGTPGGDFHPELRLPPSAVVVSKGMDPEQDSYSAFDALEADGTLLEDSLRQRAVRHLYVGGLATDYCVRWTALDALRKGFQVTVLLDASRGVNLKPHDAEQAIEELVRNGAGVATLAQLGLAEAPSLNP
ncbi:MAG: nicotinamidase [Chloroflexi bacterium]|nr:nicotinamidase [Chloroflexota bacterium]